MNARIELTENETLVMDCIKNYDTAEAQRSDNHSNVAVDKHDAKCLGFGIQALRGVVGSLVKKGLVEVSEADEDVPAMAWYTDAGITWQFSKPTDEVIKLKAGDQIKTPYDSYSPVIKVGTVGEFYKDGMYYDDNGEWDNDNKRPFQIEPWQKREALCGRNWKNQYMWTVQSGACLTSDYPGKAAEMEQKRLNYENAILVDDDDIIECEGLRFKVTCIKRQVSDPVHFMLID